MPKGCRGVLSKRRESLGAVVVWVDPNGSGSGVVGDNQVGCDVSIVAGCVVVIPVSIFAPFCIAQLVCYLPWSHSSRHRFSVFSLCFVVVLRIYDVAYIRLLCLGTVLFPAPLGLLELRYSTICRAIYSHLQSREPL